MYEALPVIVYDDQNSYLFVIGFVFSYVFTFLLMFLVGYFIYFHFKLVLTGLTTIEFKEQLTKKFTVSPYNLGFLKNITTVFGPNPFIWMVPFINYVPHEGVIYDYDPEKLVKGSKEYE